jgi:hypothetical protein
VKRCPSCAGENDDDAVNCRWCGNPLTSDAAPVEGSEPPPAAPSAAATPEAAAHPPEAGISLPPPPGPVPAPTTSGSGAELVARGEALQYTHSGRRYLLGYGADFFGIWDRQHPGPAIATFPRNDEGWRHAWLRFVADEPYNTEVSIGARASNPQPAWSSGPAPTYGYGPAPPKRQVSGAWWVLPIVFGWLGGLIAWLVNKDVDRGKANAMLITGIVISAVVFLLLVAARPS